ISALLPEECGKTKLEPYYYHYDGIGGVTSLTDDEGEIEKSYIYDAYGNILSVNGDDIINLYRFSTKEYNSKSGLIYFGARYYDPKIGRFITPDPLTWGPDDARLFENNLLPPSILAQVLTIQKKGIVNPSSAGNGRT
ncbi:MAG: RHS repeat-associated core domain-containing protein, partial [Patescibacteria group bacterium]|nr:RHS repeat-associated core domain-containing protein [Patescibacteria group bacterium]